MPAPLFLMLSAAQANPDQNAVLGVFILLCAGAAVGFGFSYFKERRLRIEAEARLGGAYAQRRQVDDESAQREATMFAQHKQMNDLQIAKLTAEVELLQNQVKAKTLDEDRIEASKEYHELMVEKTRLEMDTLRLHLMELRKRARTEDWRDE